MKSPSGNWRPSHEKKPKLWVRVIAKNGAVVEGLIDNNLEAFKPGDPILELIPHHASIKREYIRVPRETIAQYIVLAVIGKP